MRRHSISATPGLFAAFACLLLHSPIELPGAPTVSTVDEPWVAGSMKGKAEGESEPVVLALRRTNIDLEVTGALVRAKLTQQFRNHTGQRLEAVYAFPLPSRATVTAMEVRIGKRVIQSVVKKREEARETYEQARREGKATALLEQERPNFFTISIANFGPKETAEVRLEYVEQAEFRKGVCTVTFPMTIGPRYIPEDARGFPVIDDADRVTPPVVPPWIDTEHRLSLTAKVIGIPVKSIKSSTHAISVKKKGGAKVVSLSRDLVVPNKDFSMDIILPEAATPELSVIRTTAGESDYGLITLFPPTVKADGGQDDRPRDVVFLIDTSGSMSGASIPQAKAGLQQCLGMLQKSDHFTIVRFSSDYSSFSPELRKATPGKIREARAYVDGLTASGGTEMQVALDYALGIPSNEGALKMIVFLTDGAVGNEDSLMQLLTRKLGDRRLFTFGIGSAPNEFLMRKMGELGHGQSRFIRSHEDIGGVMADFFQTLETPALTDIRLAWKDADGREVPVERILTYPSVCPDVFFERPLQVVARFPEGFDGTLLLEGRRGGKDETITHRLSEAAKVESGSVDKLFGRAHIDELMFRHLRADGVVERGKIEEEVARVSMEYQLVSKFTSRVAVEKKLVRKLTGKLVSVKVPNAFPEGWDADQFFPTATSTFKRLTLGLAAAMLVLLLEGLLRWRRRSGLQPR